MRPPKAGSGARPPSPSSGALRLLKEPPSSPLRAPPWGLVLRGTPGSPAPPPVLHSIGSALRLILFSGFSLLDESGAGLRDREVPLAFSSWALPGRKEATARTQPLQGVGCLLWASDLKLEGRPRPSPSPTAAPFRSRLLPAPFQSSLNFPFRSEPMTPPDTGGTFFKPNVTSKSILSSTSDEERSDF